MLIRARFTGPEAVLQRIDLSPQLCNHDVRLRRSIRHLPIHVAELLLSIA
jgi:hypothetical protein